MSNSEDKPKIMEEILPSSTTTATSVTANVDLDQPKIMEEILPSSTTTATSVADPGLNSAVPISSVAAVVSNTGSAAIAVSKPASQVAAVPNTASESVHVSEPASRSAVVSKPASQAGSVFQGGQEEGNSLYEKDGKWLLEKVPTYSFKPDRQKQKKKVGPSTNRIAASAMELDETESIIIGNNNNVRSAPAPPQRRCCLEKGGQPMSFVQNVKAIYDTLSGLESYPCNECDKPMCQESMWHWFSSIVADMVETAKEITTKPQTASKGCGSMDADTLKENTKGTYAALDGPTLIGKVDLSEASDLYEKDGDWNLDKFPRDAAYWSKGNSSDTPNAEPQKGEGATAPYNSELVPTAEPESGNVVPSLASASTSGAVEEAAVTAESQKPGKTYAAATKAEKVPSNVASKDMDIKIELQEGSPAMEEPPASLEEPTPSPEEPTPSPEEPTPSPEEPTPSPEELTPSPEEPTPSPEELTPSPEEPAPTSSDKSHVQSMIELYEGKADEAKNTTETAAPVDVSPSRAMGSPPPPPDPRDSKRAFMIKNGVDPNVK